MKPMKAKPADQSDVCNIKSVWGREFSRLNPSCRLILAGDKTWPVQLPDKREGE
jgi:hypothetical protein